MRTPRHLPASLALVLLVAAACSGPVPSTSSGTPNSSSAAAFTPVYKNGVLQPLSDGFPSQAITLMNANAAGSADGLYVRSMQSILRDVSPVPLEILDKPTPTGRNWAETAYINSTDAGKAGYIAGIASFTGAALELVTTPVARDLKVSLKDFNPVIATEKTPFVLATRADAPWKTYAELVTYAKGHPGEVKYLANVGSQLDISVSHLMAATGWTTKKIPGGDTTTVATTLAAGAGDIAMLVPASAYPHFQAGKIRILLAIGAAAPALWKDAATTDSVGLRNAPWGSITGFVTGTSTPETHRLWLAELFRKATESPDYKKRVDTNPGLEVTIMNKTEILAAMQGAIDIGTPVIRELKLAWDQQ